MCFHNVMKILMRDCGHTIISLVLTFVKLIKRKTLLDEICELDIEIVISAKSFDLFFKLLIADK